MSTIYHYCDINAFHSILTYKKIWLSAANNMNDYKEVSWFVDKVYHELGKVVNDENRGVINDFWNHSTINRPLPYLCSFSTNGDMLSQWRAYANDGRGLSIGFNIEKLGIQKSFRTRALFRKTLLEL